MGRGFLVASFVLASHFFIFLLMGVYCVEGIVFMAIIAVPIHIAGIS